MGGSGKRDFNGLGDCIMKTAKGPKGFLGLYNGFGVSVVGIIPYRGVYFGLYDSLSAKNPYKNETGPIRTFSKFAVAQFTAIMAGYASYPFDTVRRRLCNPKNQKKNGHTKELEIASQRSCNRKVLPPSLKELELM